MRRIRQIFIAAALLAPVALSAQDRQTDRNAFSLRERIPQDQWIRVRNLNGAVHVSAATGDQVEVTATKSWRRGDPKSVRIESRKSSNGSILVCALWTDDAVCTEDRYSSHDGGRRSRDYDDRNDVSVEFEVRVPKSRMREALRLLKDMRQALPAEGEGT